MPGLRKVETGKDLFRWEVDFGRTKGRRRRKYYKTKSDAEEALRQWKQEKDVASQVWAQMAPERRVGVAMVLLEMQRHGVKLADVWSDYKARHGRKVGKALGDVRDEFLAAKEAAGLSQLYLQQLKVYLRLFCLDREHIDITEIDHAAIESWLDSRKEAPATRQTGINRLSALFSFCVRRGYMTQNPIKRVERVRVPQKDPEILTVEQCRELVAAAKRIDRGMLTYLGFALFCGIRPDETLRLTRRDVNLERGLVFLQAEKAKVRNRRIVAIIDPAKRCIEGGLGVPKTNFKKRFNKLRKEAGIKYWPHDALRKTAASHFYNIYGIDKAVEQLGHSAGVFLNVYRELVSKDETEKWFSITPH